MWQIYICGASGVEKPFTKPFKTLEDAETFINKLGIMPYTIKKVNK